MYYKILSVFVFVGMIGTCWANEPTPITLLKVVDGDTVKAIVDGEKESIRLVDIDCYETSKNPRAIWQSEYYHLSIGKVLQNGEYSKQKLKALLNKRSDIKLEWNKRDKYKRILGRLYVDELNVNDYMLTEGGCEKYVDRRKNN